LPARRFNNPPVPRLVLDNVTKSFPAPGGRSVTAVDEVSLTVADGELLTLVGPSGCGKTTLLRLLAGLETADSGHIQFDGAEVSTRPPIERDVAMVFQSHALFPHLSAFDNIALGLKLRQVARGEIAARVRETAEWLGVLHCLERKPASLSGGERQRAALGRAVVRRPKILLLDEPLSNLDEPLRRQLRAELVSLRARLELTVVHVTHDQEEALALGDRVAVMRKGRLQQTGTPREVHDAPANAFVAGFLGSPPMNLLHGTVTHREGHLVLKGDETAADGTPSSFILPLSGWRADWFSQNIGRAVLLGLRPEHVKLTDNSGVTARVTAVQYHGNESVLQLDLGGRTLVARAAAGCSLRPGDATACAFDFPRARVFDAATGAALF
jgi:ABC-type sugar transport system ATPase subunit